MPQLFLAADAAAVAVAVAAQRTYVGGIRRRLLLLVAAAVTGIVTWRVGSGRIDILGPCRLPLRRRPRSVRRFRLGRRGGSSA
ncbi:hypothetical protein ACFV24_02515 [Nocardia fluminea]|uniref:hypothetical protein n=1 Tax=Nocardia fluminea TaxID=134984 RepID=UPI00367040D9